MTIEVKVPVLPESVEDAVIAAWHKKPGDVLRRDENLLDLETDKVVLEVPSPVDGVLKEIKAEAGATVLSNDLLALIEEGAAETPAGKDETAKAEEQPAAQSVSKPESKAEAKEETRTETKAEPRSASDTSKLSPAARRAAEEENVDASQVAGSGRGGRITKGDILSHVRSGGSRQEERVKMTRLRSKIAERMKEAQNTAALLTSFNEVDLKAVMELRSKYKDEFIKQHGIKLGFMSFFVKACCHALRKFPVVNASIDGDEIVYHNYQDIGIAVSTERGLMVPIIRNAENLGLAEIEQSIESYALAARDGSIKLEDLQGGTFSITNGGIFGSLLSTPLLNPPQSAILGMHAIKERAVVVDGQVVARPMMYLALSYDHRIIDGKDAVQFLVAVKEALEDPARLLLNL
ncbi:MAG TPA: 2-oxoglutarate dehydrogenase complex dihydrolipoyllysine-residue succinyltransferase [Xanthomonadales bacterium]|nr:2-oxoglutarate dehydrogenase complex dihydrolipoyllysine-residue succinyltransferase [Xanthomonadales bacterium]